LTATYTVDLHCTKVNSPTTRCRLKSQRQAVSTATHFRYRYSLDLVTSSPIGHFVYHDYSWMWHTFKNFFDIHVLSLLILLNNTLKTQIRFHSITKFHSECLFIVSFFLSFVSFKSTRYFTYYSSETKSGRKWN
jgi:hypothetical protein